MLHKATCYTADFPENDSLKGHYAEQAHDVACHQHNVAPDSPRLKERPVCILGDCFELVLIWLVTSHKATLVYRYYGQSLLWSIRSKLLVH